MKKKYREIEVENYIIELRYKYYNHTRIIRCENKKQMISLFSQLSNCLDEGKVTVLDSPTTKDLDWNETIDMSAIASIRYYTYKSTKIEEY